MAYRRWALGVGAAALVAAAVTPVTADAQADAPDPVTVTALPSDARKGQPASSAAAPSTGELATTSSPDVEPLPGAPEPQLVIGTDTRTKVADTGTFPGSAVVRLSVNPAVGTPFSCTGWLISPDTVATAAHCLAYPTGTYTVIPGWNGVTGSPSCSNLVGAFAPDSWIDANGSGPARDDYAALKLNTTLCPDYTGNGHFGYRQVGDTRIKGLKHTIDGYPSDKPDGGQWRSTGKIKRATKNLVFYKTDTYYGNSGSPVYKVFKNCGTCAIAIHASNFAAVPENGGTRIRKAVGKFLSAVKDMP